MSCRVRARVGDYRIVAGLRLLHHAAKAMPSKLSGE
jgi:hypothetical protein